jgi:hypothetical protein
MTYNFDPERWYENEYSTLETLYKNGTITDSEFDDRCSNLQKRYEEMLSRLDGTYLIAKEGERNGN